MANFLVADIGGTNSRFALSSDDEIGVAQVTIFENDLFSDFAAVLRKAVETLGNDFTNVTLAVAGPKDDGKVTLTNRGWLIDPEALSTVCAGKPVYLVNDFEAMARSLPHLSTEGVKILLPGEQVDGHKLVLGPGTGLGVGYLIRTTSDWLAAPGEGGHVSLPVQTAREMDILEAIRDLLQATEGEGVTRISAERSLCGPGLANTFNAIARLQRETQRVEKSREVIALHRSGDAIAREAVDFFHTLLGRVAGDLALALIPKGGVYVGGGLAPTLFDLVGPEVFLAAYQERGRVSEALNGVPVQCITDQHAGLLGAAACAHFINRGEVT